MAACSSLVKIDGYIFEWNTAVDYNLQRGEFQKSDLFYAGFQKETSWCIRLFPNGDTLKNSSLSCYLVIVNGNPVTMTAYMTLMDGESVVGTRLFSNIVLNDKYESLKCHMYIKEKFFKNRIKIKWNLQILDDMATLPYFRKMEGENGLIIDIHNLLGKEKTKDIFLVSKEGKVLRAHKSILTARSKVFADMFQDDVEEKLYKLVNMEDISEEVLKELLLYVYSGDPSVWNCGLAKKLFVVGDKYKISGLKERCSKFLASHLNVDSVTEIFILAHTHADKSLKDACKRFITKNATDVLKTSGWACMLKEQARLVNEVIIELARK